LSTVNFGQEMIVGETRTVTLQVLNEGRNNLDVSAIRSDIAGISLSDTTLLIAPGGSRELSVTIMPTEGGTLSGTLTFISNDPEKETFQLSIDPLEILVPPGALSLQSGKVDFGNIEVNRNAIELLTLENVGAGPLTILRIESDIPGLTASANSVEIAAGESLEVGLSVRPDLEGSFSGTLTIFSDDPNGSSALVQISGFGTVILADSRADFNNDQKVNLGDFILFAKAYNTTDPLFDLNDNSVVDFGDFVIFVRSFGRPLP